MNCEDVTKLADDLVDGRLGLADRMRIRAHLFVCIHCRRYIDQLRTTISAVRSRSWAEASPGSIDRALDLFPARPDEREKSSS